MTGITPKTNTLLIGHETAEAILMEGYFSGKLAHGWILSGPRGIGKATLAYRFARTLLSGIPPEDMHEEHPIFCRIAAGSHSDMLVIEQAYDEKKEELVREISVEQARGIANFLSMTPGEGAWRVVIIDSADALNTNGANAILKILEEPPPQSVILLIAHNQGKLLPTIRSRCRNLRLHPLNYEQFRSVMRQVKPALETSEIKALAQLSAFSPGVALELHAQGALEVYSQIIELLTALPQLDSLKIHAFADVLSGSQVHTKWQLFTRLALALLERAGKQAAGVALEAISDEESAVLHKLAGQGSANSWAEKWQQFSEQFSLADRLHLDYKQAVIVFFHSILNKEGVLAA